MGEAQNLKSPIVCKNYMKVAFAATGHREAIFTRLRCKMWACEACAKTNAWIWRNWLLKRIPEMGGDWYLLTLTAPSFARTRDGSLAALRDNWDAFIKRAKRVFGGIDYVRVYEKHPSSQAIHLHAIISGFAPYVALGYSSKLRPMAIGCLSRRARDGVWSLKTWVKKTAQELKMGYIADVQRIEGEASKAVWYVTKYLTKAQADLHVKGLRHVQTSSGVGSPPKEETDLVWSTAAYVTADMVGEKTKMRDLQTNAIIDQNHWEMHNFYPHED